MQATVPPVSVGADAVFADPRMGPRISALAGPKRAIQGRRKPGWGLTAIGPKHLKAFSAKKIDAKST
jgi:hypothetical protein